MSMLKAKRTQAPVASGTSRGRNERRHLARRARLGIGIAAVLFAPAGYLTLSSLAGTGQAGAATTGSYGGSASADLVTLDALDIPGTMDLANAQVAPALAQVSSTGSLPGSAQAYAHATNLNVNLLSGAIPLDNLLVQATQSSPPANASPVSKQLLSLPANPLLDATLASASAHADFLPNGACLPAGTPISDASSALANASVLNGVIPGGAGTSLLALDNAQGSTVFTHSTVGLVSESGQSTYGVQSSAITQLTALTLFKGTSNQLTVNVLAPPTVTATATGQPGGASVTYTEPILQIVQGSKVLGTLDAASANTSISLAGLGTLSLGQLTNVVKAPNGTSASGSASLLTLTLGGSGTPIPATVVHLAIAPASVSATVPAGGVVCTSVITSPTSSHTPVATGPSAPSSGVPSGAAPSQETSAVVTSPTAVHTGEWFAGAMPWLLGSLAGGILLIAWPKLDELAAMTRRAASARRRS